MTAKPVWAHPVEEAAWREKWCRTCFQPDELWKRIDGTGDGCPLLARAAQNKVPNQWTRRRNAVMGDTYRCSDYAPKSPVNRRKSTPADTIPIDELFDVEINSGPAEFVPVENWPDAQAFGIKQPRGVDHS